MKRTDPHNGLAPTRPSLLFRLRDWNDESTWTEFYGLYHDFIFALARRSGLSHADAEEVTQDVFRRVAETIGDFECDSNRGTFRGWLAKLTRWRVLDKHRARPPEEVNQWDREASPPDRTRTIDRLPDDNDTLPWGSRQAEEEEWQRHVVEAALGRLARRVPAKQFQVFDLFVRQEWPVTKIADELGVSVASVYLTKHRLTHYLKGEVNRLHRILR